MWHFREILLFEREILLSQLLKFYLIFLPLFDLFYSKKIIYTAYIRSILSYACPVFSNCAKTHTQKLQVTQNKCLRMVLGVQYATMITTLHKEANIPYIKEFIEKLTARFYQKCNLSKSSLIANLDDYSKVNYRIKRRLPRKIGFRF